jgi:hypothetical protein
VSAAQLNQYRVDGSDLDAVAAAMIADLGGLDVVFSVWLEESKRGEPFNQLAPGFGAGKALKKLLQHQPGSEDLICSPKSVLESLDLGEGSLGVSAECE